MLSTLATTILRTLWLAATVMVVVGSLLPAGSTPMRLLSVLHINDKLEHVGAYAVLAFLPAIHERRSFIIAAAIGIVLLGIGLEFGQLFLGWRDFEIGDMVADAVGVCFGIGVAISIRSSGFIRSIGSAGNDRRAALDEPIV
jgi:VanZ family protein